MPTSRASRVPEAVVRCCGREVHFLADNVLRRGRMLNADSRDPGVVGMRAFNDRVVSD